MEVRITFRSEIFLEGESLKDIKHTFETLPLFSADAIDNNCIDYVEVVGVDQIEGTDCIDVLSEYKSV